MVRTVVMDFENGLVVPDGQVLSCIEELFKSDKDELILGSNVMLYGVRYYCKKEKIVFKLVLMNGTSVEVENDILKGESTRLGTGLLDVPYHEIHGICLDYLLGIDDGSIVKLKDTL